MKKQKTAHKSTFFVVFILIAVLTYLAFFGVENYYGDKREVIFKGANDIRWGIDIRGGVEAVYTPIIENKKSYSLDNAKSDMDAAKAIIETRLVDRNITDYEIYTDYSDFDNMQVIVRFPWTSDESDFDPAEAVKEIGETALLTFSTGTTKDNVILTAKDNDFERADPGVDQDTGKYIVYLTFTKSGQQKFSAATASLANSGGGQISIWLDDKCLSAPTVDKTIDSKTCYIQSNSSDFTADYVNSLANKINAGNLPFELSIDDSKLQVISPTLGSEALDVMLIAGACAMLVVCILMILRYRLPGLISCFALVGQIAGIIACTSGFFSGTESFTLTIPGIAGIILSIGIGVDANVIAAERIRDEFKRGKTIDGAIANGFNNSMSSIIDGNVTVIIVSVVLMGAFGTPNSILAKVFKPLLFMFSSSISGTIYSFGYTLLIGVIFNFIMAVLATRLMLKSVSRLKFLRNPWLYGAQKTSTDKEGK